MQAEEVIGVILAADASYGYLESQHFLSKLRLTYSGPKRCYGYGRSRGLEKLESGAPQLLLFVCLLFSLS